MGNEINGKLLKAQMVEHGDTQEALASVLNLPQSAISARITGKVPFKRNEMAAIRKRYSLSSHLMIRIFFPEEVSETDTECN